MLQKRTPGSLYGAFARFSYDIYRSGYKPAPAYRLVAPGAVKTTRPLVVRGLSTHYIPIAVPAGA